MKARLLFLLFFGVLPTFPGPEKLIKARSNLFLFFFLLFLLWRGGPSGDSTSSVQSAAVSAVPLFFPLVLFSSFFLSPFPFSSFFSFWLSPSLASVWREGA